MRTRLRAERGDKPVGLVPGRAARAWTLGFGSGPPCPGLVNKPVGQSEFIRAARCTGHRQGRGAVESRPEAVKAFVDLSCRPGASCGFGVQKVGAKLRQGGRRAGVKRVESGCVFVQFAAHDRQAVVPGGRRTADGGRPASIAPRASSWARSACSPRCRQSAVCICSPRSARWSFRRGGIWTALAPPGWVEEFVAAGLWIGAGVGKCGEFDSAAGLGLFHPAVGAGAFAGEALGHVRLPRRRARRMSPPIRRPGTLHGGFRDEAGSAGSLQKVTWAPPSLPPGRLPPGGQARQCVSPRTRGPPPRARALQTPSGHPPNTP